MNNEDHRTKITITEVIGGFLWSVLVVLKLLNLIEISWLWVLSPLWVPLGLLIAFAILFTAALLVTIIIAAVITARQQLSETCKDKNKHSD